VAIKIYKAVIYVTVEDLNDGNALLLNNLIDYCASATVLDLDTEEHGNPHQIESTMIDWATLEEVKGVGP